MKFKSFLIAIQHFFQDLFNTKASKRRLEKERKVNKNIEDIRRELKNERLENERLENERLEKEKLNNDLYEVAQSELQAAIDNNQEYEDAYIKPLEEQIKFERKIEGMYEKNRESIEYKELRRNEEKDDLKEYFKYNKLIKEKPLNFFICKEKGKLLDSQYIFKELFKKIHSSLYKEKYRIKCLNLLCTILTKQIEAHKKKSIPVENWYVKYLSYILIKVSGYAASSKTMAPRYVKIFELLLDPVFNLKDYIYQDAIYSYVYGEGSHMDNGEMLRINATMKKKNPFTIEHFIITIDYRSKKQCELFKHQRQLIKLLIDSGSNFNIKADGCADNKTAAELIFRDVNELCNENQIPRIKLRIAFTNHLLIHTKYLDSLGVIWLKAYNDENTNEYIQDKINYLTKLKLLIEEIPQNIQSMTEEQVEQLEKTIRDKVNKILTIAINASCKCETEDLQNALRGILNSLPLHEDQCERLKYILSSIKDSLPSQFNILFDYYKNNDLEILAEKIPQNLFLLYKFSSLYQNIKTGKKNLYDFVDEVISQIEKIVIGTQNQNDKEDLNKWKNDLSQHSKKLKEQDIESALKNDTNIILSKKDENICTTIISYSNDRIIQNYPLQEAPPSITVSEPVIYLESLFEDR